MKIKTALIFMLISYNTIFSFLGALAFIPLLLHIKRISNISVPKYFDPELKKLALSTVLLAILLGVGYVL